MGNITEGSGKSSEKRNSNFVIVRRGVFRPEHWANMSGNEAKLFVWLLGAAHWSGAKRGLVETTFEDMARANGLSYSTVQRTIAKLEEKPYIEVERAINQNGLTIIKILKYDVPEDESTPVRSGQIDRSKVRSGRRSGQRSGQRSGKIDRSKPASSQNPQDLQAPKKSRSKKEEKVSHDGPDRTFHTRKTKNLSLKGKAWEELEVKSLPAMFEPFVNLVEKNPRGADEHFVDWAKRIMDLCAEEGTEYPKVFYKRFKQAERELDNQDDPYGEMARVNTVNGLGPEWAHLMKDPSEPQDRTPEEQAAIEEAIEKCKAASAQMHRGEVRTERSPAVPEEEPDIDAEMAQQLLAQFPEAWDAADTRDTKELEVAA